MKDVCEALELNAKFVKQRLGNEVVSSNHIMDTLGRMQEMLIVNEFGIYETIFSSKKKQAKEFKKWVYKMIQTLRQETGLQGFEVFRMLDKEHQKQAMKKLSESLKSSVRVDFIKANTITNKAVSNKHGYSKMIRKGEMTPQMLKEREPILEDTVELLTLNDKYGLNVQVSDAIYKKWN